MRSRHKKSFSVATQTLMDRYDELEGIIRFWLETQLDDSPIYDHMEKNGVDKLTIKIVTTYVFELEDEET